MGPTGSNYTNYYGQPASKKFLNKKVLFIFGIVAVLIIIVFGIINASMAGDSIETQSAHLSARLTNLSTLSDSADANIKGNDVKKLNAEISIITASAQGQLATTFPKKISKEIVTAEADTTSTDKLAAAILTGTYDDEYKSVMTTKLESVNALLSEMYAKTKDRTLRSALDQSYKDYTALQARIATLN